MRMMDNENKAKTDTGQEEAVKAETAQEVNSEDTAAAAAEGAAPSGENTKDSETTVDIETAPSEEDKAATEPGTKEKKSFFKKKDKEKEALQEKIASLEDRLKRQMAEFDNYRKRTDREKEQMFGSGESSVLEKMLPIVDNFERGFSTVTEEDKEDAFVLGMHKVYDQLIKQLQDLGVTAIDAEGKDFDPAFHNAVMQVESDQYETGKVAQELQKGYLYHDKVLRHSMVSVVK